MNGGGVFSTGSAWPCADAGNACTLVISDVIPVSDEFIHSTNFAASAGCLELVVTASVSPPQMPTVLSPAVQVGNCTAAHLPAVSLAIEGSWFGPHWAPTQPTIVPLFMSVFHWA